MSEASAPTPEVLAAVQEEFSVQLAEAGQNEEELQRIRSTFFGPKGRLTRLLKSVGQLPPEARRDAGRMTNEVKRSLEGALTEVLEATAAQALEKELRRGRLDMSLPGRRQQPRGSLHPVTQINNEMVDIFARMGFEVAGGPEVETDFHNFGALNFPDDHPARDMQDTFFVRSPDDRPPGSLVLRTHTSPVQIRAMMAQGAPIRIVAPGRVYRCDSDPTHSPMFHQIEGLWVDEGVSMAHLRGVLTGFINALFGERGVRLRPSFFPFVEPGVEVDLECVFCDGAGCSVCKQTGWMEILGAGMVHPNVLRACNIDAEKYTGFAFGLGIDRVAMLRWAVDDLAHMFRSDVRFLSQI